MRQIYNYADSRATYKRRERIETIKQYIGAFAALGLFYALYVLIGASI